MVVYLFNCTMGNSSKLTWMLIIAALPQAGAALLLFVRTDLGHRVIKRRMAQIVDETLDAIPQPPEAMAALHGDSDGTDDLAHYLSRSGCYPVYAGSQARYFPSGETKLEALMEELEKAEKYIFLEYFILEEGYMWGRVLNTLIEKAAQGVEVRVLYDGMCELQKLPFHYTRLLEARGIKAKIFAPSGRWCPRTSTTGTIGRCWWWTGTWPLPEG